MLLIEEQESDGNPSNTAASVGTLILEWMRLSNLTGNPEYGVLTQKAMEYMLKPQPSWTEAIPGIVGNWINVDDGQFTDTWGSWGPAGDSFYECMK
jgi:mannosyl-oligosaccharide alpha-1,2-mannosidase